MRLFNAIEKCFPEMRKHKEWLFSKQPAAYWKDPDHLWNAKEEMQQWIQERYLDEHSVIYQLFRMAGVESKGRMADMMLLWHIYDWNIEHKLSRKGTSPARR